MANETRSRLHTSAVTLAEATDGSSRDANVRRTQKMLDVEPVTADIGYKAGRLRAKASKSRRKPRDLTVDAVVAATALSLPAPVVVLTSETGDLELLLDGTGARVERIN